MTSRYSIIDVTLLLVRLILAIVVGAHGAQKLFGWFGGYGYEGTMNFFTDFIGLPYFMGLLIILAESAGMISLALGLLSRFISAALIVIMAGAIVTTHMQHGFFMNWSGALVGEGFEFHLLIIAQAGVLLLNGAGALSVDSWIKEKSKSQKNLVTI
jgi:putative oxidoreductase